MKNKTSLREFQAQLNARLQNVAQRAGESAKLGFIAGGRHWLTDLDQVSEVVTVRRLTPVPWARPWFLGVANVRGALFGCSDFAAFLGGERLATQGEFRLLLSHARFGMNAAFRIERPLGLRTVSSMSPRDMGPDTPPWVLSEWRDEAGVEWTEISMERLVGSPEFLQAGMA